MVVVVAVAPLAALLAADGGTAAMAAEVAMAVSPESVVEVAAADDALGRVAVAQWVTNGRIRAVTAAFKRTAAEVEEEQAEEEEVEEEEEAEEAEPVAEPVEGAKPRPTS